MPRGTGGVLLLPFQPPAGELVSGYSQWPSELCELGQLLDHGVLVQVHDVPRAA